MRRSHLLLSLVIGLLGVAAPPTNAEEPPNIFFFFADDWGRYAGNSYGEIDGIMSRTKDPRLTDAFDSAPWVAPVPAADR